VAVVVGGAATVWDEIGKTAALTRGMKVRYFVVNDMLPLFPGPCVAVSLHPDKLKDWLKARSRAGWPKPDQVWTHVGHEDATDFVEHWRGSSGLHAVTVALKLRYQRIVLCGAPMTKEGGHVVRDEPWTRVDTFIGGWKAHKAEIAPYVRSWSGWTAELLGRPDMAFLTGDALVAA
jgi:hypothetical protein